MYQLKDYLQHPCLGSRKPRHACLVSWLSGPQASDTRSYRGVCLDVLTSGDWTNVTRGNGVGEDRLLDLGACTNHSGKRVHCSIRAFLVVLPS
jgi:hypothetical protein